MIAILKPRSRLIPTLSMVLVLALVQACSTESPTEQPVKFVSVESAVAAAKEGMTIVDVRTDSEWNAGHLQAARHLPLSGLDEALPASNLDRTKPVLLHCQSGGRATRASHQFVAAGFSDVRVLKPGGYAELAQAGLPTAPAGE